jgi:hypothetical protein
MVQYRRPRSTTLAAKLFQESRADNKEPHVPFSFGELLVQLGHRIDVSFAEATNRDYESVEEFDVVRFL